MWLKDQLRTLKCLLWACMDALTLLGCGRKTGAGVAIVRLDAIGDFVLWLDAAQHWRSLYPGQRLVLVANALWADWAAQLDWWDEVWPIEPARLMSDGAYRRRVLRDMRSRGFDVAVQPTCSRSFYLGDSLIRASAASQRIGSAGDTSNITAAARRISDRWYTRLISGRANAMSEVLRNDEFMSGLAGHTLPRTSCELPVGRGGAEVLGALSSTPYFVVFPGASHAGRQWPAEHWRAVVQSVQAWTPWAVVLCGSAADRAMCEQIAVGAQGAVQNIAGQTTLAELAEVLRRARWVLGNETSAIHIAAKVGTPSVCILGGGHHGRFLPYPSHVMGCRPVVADHPMPCYHCNWQCSMDHTEGQPFPCVAAVSVDQVFKLVQSLEKTLQR